MKKVIKYKCSHCDNLFDSEKECLEHEERHKKFYEANQMLEDGHTFKEIQNKHKIWNEIPKGLENFTTVYSSANTK